MRFARTVFLVAGMWGLFALTPLLFAGLADADAGSPWIDQPGFYYGFAGVALAWQIAFLVIATDPGRFRPMMPVAVVEKASYVISIAALYAQRRIDAGPMVYGAIADLVLGLLFVAAFLRTRRRPAPPAAR